MTADNRPVPARQTLRLALVALFAAGGTVLVMMLNSNVATRKAEATQTSFKIVDLDEKVVDPAQWGKNFPRQYDAYLRTAERYSTKYGGAGSEGFAKSRLEDDPRLVTIFDGCRSSNCSARRNGASTSSTPRTAWASTRRRKRPASSAKRSTTRARARSRCAT